MRVGWAARAHKWKMVGLLAIATACIGAGVPAIVSAYGEIPDEVPAVEEEEQALPGWEVTENPASYDPGYGLQPRTISGDGFGPEYREYLGPVYMEGPGPEVPDGAPAEPEEVLVRPLVTEAASGAQPRVVETAPGYVEVVTRPAEGYSANLARMADYPVAAQVYDRLHGWGWSDVCIAGVLGNMMAECGGQTLALEPYDDTTEDGVRYFGLCQWSMRYNPDVDGLDVDGQLAYLGGNIEGNMAYFGRSQDTYSRWLQSTDAAQAARDFCTYYERGAGKDRRATNAVAAYEWILAAYGA